MHIVRWETKPAAAATVFLFFKKQQQLPLDVLRSWRSLFHLVSQRSALLLWPVDCSAMCRLLDFAKPDVDILTLWTTEFRWRSRWYLEKNNHLSQKSDSCVCWPVVWVSTNAHSSSLSVSLNARFLGAFIVRINTEVAIFTHCLRWTRVGVPCVPSSDQHRDSSETAKLDKIPEYLRDTMDWFMG